MTDKLLLSELRYATWCGNDIVAINGRLKHFGAKKKSEEEVHSDSICDKKIVGRETPIERHRLCIAAIQVEIEEHHYRLEQSKQNE